MDEFDVIAQHFVGLTQGHKDSFSLTDDAALLNAPEGMKLVVTKDVLNEGVHFIGSETPEQLAAKALRVNLSDLAAMGAKPYSYMLGLGLPSSISADWIARFAAQLGREQNEFGLFLTGGDTTNTQKHISLSVTMFGIIPQSEQPLKRNGAKAGDGVYVSGQIGDGYLGLLAAQAKIADPSGKLAEAYYSPTPQLALGESLRGIATAAMDISDGLVQDLGHLCKASGVGADIEASAIPTSHSNEPLEKLLTGGDDYQLLFTAPQGMHFEGCTEIGIITEGNEVNFFDAEDALLLFTNHKGWQHCFEDQ